MRGILLFDFCLYQENTVKSRKISPGRVDKLVRKSYHKTMIKVVKKRSTPAAPSERTAHRLKGSPGRHRREGSFGTGRLRKRSLIGLHDWPRYRP